MTDPAREPDHDFLNDTVADEELAPEEASGAPVVPNPPPPQRPPPVREYRAPPPRRDPAPPPPRRIPPPEPRPPRGDEDIRLLEHEPDRERARAITQNVDLSRIFDDTTQPDDNPVGRYDPEAGKGDVAIKLTAATEAVAEAVRGVVSGTFTTPFGKLILSLAAGLAGIAATIAAITIQDRWMIIAAAVLAPIGFILVYWRYQAWLGHKRYMYRLLETLGEDVSEFRPDQAFRRTKVKTSSNSKRRK